MHTSDVKTMVITGASSGFGRALALQAAKKGNYQLVLGARRQERLDSLKQEIQHISTQSVFTHILDVTDTLSVANFVGTAAQQGGAFDILVNNAGLALGKDAWQYAQESDWQRMMDTNVMGMFRMTQKCLPFMKASPIKHIVNMASTAGIESYEGGAGYCGSKFAVRAMTRALRMELLDENFRVTLISPGMAQTEFSEVRFHGDLTKAQATYQGMQALSADDVAQAILYAIEAPDHVNIDEIVLTPRAQASPTKIRRDAT